METLVAWRHRGGGPVMAQRPDPAERARRARKRLRARRAKAVIADQAAEPAPLPAQRSTQVWRGWPADGPPGLRRVHTELSALQVVRRAELLIALGFPEDSLYRDPDINSPDELEAARLLLWTASSWMDTNTVLDLVAVAAIGRGWSEVPASELFAELLPDPEPGPMGDEPEEPPQP